MARREAWGYYKSFPRSHPIRTRGGIKAQSQRGSFVASWWARRWIEVLEGFDIGARLERGRRYARQGQVLSIDVGKGEVNAMVQGSRAVPYRVGIWIKPLPPDDWSRLAASLGRHALFTARLLNGEMPAEIEDLFNKAGFSLFPRRAQDLVTECTCPDLSNPCKHIAAVYYLLAEEFDRDPFLIFKLRGMEREELIRLLGGGTGAKRKAPARPSRKVQPVDAPSTIPAPLPAVLDLFWTSRGPGGDGPESFSMPEQGAALIRRLGKFPFWRGETNLTETLEEIYREASQAVLEKYLNRID